MPRRSRYRIRWSCGVCCGTGRRGWGSETARLETLRQRLTELAGKRVMRDQMAYVQDQRMELVHLQKRLGDLASALLARCV